MTGLSCTISYNLIVVDTKDYHLWRQQQVREIKEMDDINLDNRIREYEVKIKIRKHSDGDDDASKIINNVVLILTVYVTVYFSIILSQFGSANSIASNLISAVEDVSQKIELDKFVNEIFSNLHRTMFQGLGILVLLIAIEMLVLVAVQKKIHKKDMWHLFYYEEMINLLKSEKKKLSKKMIKSNADNKNSGNKNSKKKG